MPKFELVILANSIKHNQHCVAGKCTRTGQWVRPVADQNGGALSHDQAKCRNKYGLFNVKPMQKVIMNLPTHAPLQNQPENYIRDNSDWQQNFKIEDRELPIFLDDPDSLWGAGDSVPYVNIEFGFVQIQQSLNLVRVESLNLYLNTNGKRRASFSYKGQLYDLSVTDPGFDEILAGRKTHQNIICVSLGEEFQGNCYKIVASIF